MSIKNRISDWLETKWVNPAYSGWLISIISICFFGSAVNTMAGWLYAISGISFALLGLAAFLPPRELRQLQVRRRSIQPVTVGDRLTIELEIENKSKQPKTLLQVQDVIPYVLGKPVQTPIEIIASQSVYKWVYYQTTEQRGVYSWQTVQLRTAAPLGLFWSRRRLEVAAKAIVYPTVLPLNKCPLVDEIGAEENSQLYNSDRRSYMATEGITKALRPYRIGDPIRLIHWRTSARYGDLKVRELEVFTSGQELIICLDTASAWRAEDFEQAVIAAATLYFYACRCQMNVKLWTALTGLVHGNRVVLETLAATNPNQEPNTNVPTNVPIVWLTHNPISLKSLPRGSRWMFWSPAANSDRAVPVSSHPGIVVNQEQPLELQMRLRGDLI